MAKKNTPKPIIKSLSFKYKNYDCYEYIKDMYNFSDYICDLIRLDMEYDILRNKSNLTEPVTNEVPKEDTKEKTNNFVAEKQSTKIQTTTTEDTLDTTDTYNDYENF